VRASDRWRLGEIVEDGLPDGWQAWLRWRSLAPFFRPGDGQAARLEKGECHHGHQGMAMQSDPRSSFEMIEAEFIF
jgi:hypothetical protein